MIDKAITTLTKQPNPSANIKDEISRPQQVAGGVDKFKKEKGLNLKKVVSSAVDKVWLKIKK